MIHNPALILANTPREDQERFQQAVLDSALNLSLFQWDGINYSLGPERWMRAVSRPFRQDDGRTIWDGVMFDISANKRAEDAERRAAAQEALIDQQTALLVELSTPLIPLAEGVLVMPLIGTLTDTRLQDAIEHLLEGVAIHQAETVLLDITGVKEVDTSVANGLIQAARAVRLLGARIILTGIQPRMAQTLIQLGVNLSDIITYSTLQTGIAATLKNGSGVY
ncbi:MAG: STAS domain-containing protein [Blastochloris sp.]|nr:STAS domain-containing protein [Blastochloris sp.]